MVVVVTPVPDDPHEKSAKRWQRRQDLQAILTSLTVVQAAMQADSMDPEVAAKLHVASELVREGMELLSPTPRPRLKPKERFPWDK